jgi:hypothetical protein
MFFGLTIMTTFLLWNVQDKLLDGYIVRLAQQHRADVLLLIEQPKPDDTLFAQLNTVGVYERVPSQARFGVYVRFKSSKITRVLPAVSNDRVDYWDITVSKRNPLLLVLVHGLDIINNSEQKRELFFDRLTSNILAVEARLGHKNTVVVGDFNANPFDAIVGGARGLHAIHVRDVGGKRIRSIANQDYEFFCNPMWSCFKGWEIGPPGTHYFNGSDVHELFWHMLDQIVMRPQVLHMFSERNLRVLTQAGHVSLLTNRGLPDANMVSDHLPVLFKLNLNAMVNNG